MHNTVITVIGGGFCMKPTTSKEAKMLLERSIENFEIALQNRVSSPLIEMANESMFKALELFSTLSVMETIKKMFEELVELEASAPSENVKH